MSQYVPSPREVTLLRITHLDDDGGAADRPSPLVHSTKTSPRQKTRNTKYITCSSTQELTRAVEFSLKKTNVVAELGAQLRNVSQAICKNTKEAVLVDITRKVPHQVEQKSRAMRRPGMDESRLPSHATFVQIDSLEQWRRALFGRASSTSYDAFVLDVNAICGNDLGITSLSIIQEFLVLNDMMNGDDQRDCCRVVMVKSASLNKWASQLIHVKKWNHSDNTRIPFPHIITCVGVQEYRQTIQQVARPGDAILEVGCHLGTTTALLHEKATSDGDGYCIGVDVGPSIIKKAKKRHGNVYFAVGDAWKTAELLRIQQDYLHGVTGKETTDPRSIGFDVVYVDVGGLSGSDGLLEALMLLSSLSNALEPRCIIIKSLCMQRLASTLVPYWRAQKEMIE